MSDRERLIFHIDVNSAFLSWESARRLREGGDDLRLVPSVIGGDPNKRTGIVVAKSIPAKKYGIVTGEPMAMALRKCPNLVIASPDFRLYDKCSKAFKAICKEYAPVMESFSIDEVFMDMTGTSLIYPDPIKTAYEIKDRIRNELGFTVNVGIGRCKVCAKMASDFEKPDKVHTLFPDEIKSKMWPLPIGELFLCGKQSALRFEQNGIRTIGDLAVMPLKKVQSIVGDKHGRQLHEYANGIDDSAVSDAPEEAKGYSAETTLEDDLVDIESIERMLLAQADVVGARMRADKVKCSCVAVSFRTVSFQKKSHQKKLINSTDSTTLIYEAAKELIRECWKGQPLRLIGLAVSDIDKGLFSQMSFGIDPKQEKYSKIDSAVDSIRGKYGNASILRAGAMEQGTKISKRYQAIHENSVRRGDDDPTGRSK